MARPDEELNVWKEMEGMAPANNPFRLQALIKLGEMYEKYNDFTDAASVYKNLARSASGSLATQALERAKALAAEAKRQGSSAPVATDTGSSSNPPESAAPNQMPGMQ
jgi:hypothetical protein